VPSDHHRPLGARRARGRASPGTSATSGSPGGDRPGVLGPRSGSARPAGREPGWSGTTGNLAKTSTEARVQQTNLGRDIDRTGASAGRAERSIDKYSGRLRTLADLITIGGPAALRLGAGALPLVTAGYRRDRCGRRGIGVAVLALQGFDNALKALSTYELDPTVENLQKLRIELEKLGPAGADFLHFLDDLEPQLKDLQNLARAGLFPGVEEGIDSLLTRLPLVRQTVNRVSQELGRLAADAGSALASDEWTPFFNYIRTNAAPILDDFARSTGNVALGLRQHPGGLQPPQPGLHRRPGGDDGPVR
jgi:hypothetical protein